MTQPGKKDTENRKATMQFEEEEMFFRKIASETGLLTIAQVEECLEIQKRSSKPGSLFVIMIDKGYINRKNMAEILKNAPPQIQQQTEIDGDSQPEKKFGELCIEKGFASSAQVAECLAIQDRLKREGKHFRIGQILIEKKYVAVRQAQLILKIQGKKILRCPACETKFNIRRYKSQKKYRCPKCANELVSSAPSASMNVERSFMTRDSVDVDDEALSLLHNKIGEYEIVELLGEGGMADVYKVVSRSRKRPRALKVMKSQAGILRFNREFESAHSLRHPNIVRVYETGKIKNRPYFFMEYLEGGTLAKRIEKMGVISLLEGLNILKQVTMGLKYAHENNITHRDIKSSNIMLTRGIKRDFIAKITDFGIARSPSDSQITVTGQLVGTFKYMAPEYIKGQNVGGWSDIFSLGIVAYEMFTGREPFNVDAPVGYLFVNIKEMAPPLHHINPDLPKTLSLIVNQMVAKDYRQRYDAASLLRDLDRFIKHLREGTRLHEIDDRTSVFYTNATFYSLKGLWGKIFSRQDIKEEEVEVPVEDDTTDSGIGAVQAFDEMMETEEVGRDATAQKQYEFAVGLLEKGDIEGARKNLNALMEVFPGSSWARRASKKLHKLETMLSPGDIKPAKEKDSSSAPKKKLLR